MANALPCFLLQITGLYYFESLSWNDYSLKLIRYSDTMGNLGAFITLNGKDMKPKYTTYEAVVSVSSYSFTPTLSFLTLKLWSIPASSPRQANGVRTKLDEPHIMSLIDKKISYDVHHVIMKKKQIK